MLKFCKTLLLTVVCISCAYTSNLDLWKKGDIKECCGNIQNIDKIQYKKISIGIDPAVTIHDDSNETGIIVAGLTEDGKIHILEDFSGKISTETTCCKTIPNSDKIHMLYRKSELYTQILTLDKYYRVIDSDNTKVDTTQDFNKNGYNICTPLIKSIMQIFEDIKKLSSNISIICESNNGGDKLTDDTIKADIRYIDSKNIQVNNEIYEGYNAKQKRAKMLYDFFYTQKKVCHINTDILHNKFQILENQMITFNSYFNERNDLASSNKSPDRIDALFYAIYGLYKCPNDNHICRNGIPQCQSNCIKSFFQKHMSALNEQNSNIRNSNFLNKNLNTENYGNANFSNNKINNNYKINSGSNYKRKSNIIYNNNELTKFDLFNDNQTDNIDKIINREISNDNNTITHNDRIPQDLLEKLKEIIIKETDLYINNADKNNDITHDNKQDYYETVKSWILEDIQYYINSSDEIKKNREKKMMTLKYHYCLRIECTVFDIIKQYNENGSSIFNELKKILLQN